MAAFVICSKTLDSFVDIRAASFCPHNNAVLRARACTKPQQRNYDAEANLGPFQVFQRNCLAPLFGSLNSSLTKLKLAVNTRKTETDDYKDVLDHVLQVGAGEPWGAPRQNRGIDIGADDDFLHVMYQDLCASANVR